MDKLNYELQEETKKRKEIDKKLYQAIFGHQERDLNPIVAATANEYPNYSTYRHLLENKKNMQDLLDLANETIREQSISSNRRTNVI